jgi:RNA polymerase sigma-70 factor (ECF subfamily)
LAIRHLDAAHTLARWLMRDAAEADDVVQEAFLRAFRAFHTFSGPDIKPWLLRVVRNSAYRRLSNQRRAGNVVSIEDAFGIEDDGEPGEARIASEEPNAEEWLVGEADRSLAVAALATLQPIHREVLVLREIEELSYLQISDIARIPVGTVMSRLARARALLRDAFLELSRKQAQ